MLKFAERVKQLPRLGVGLSGEFNVAAKGMDVNWVQANYPGLVHFYEYGGDLDRGLDEGVRRWAANGGPATYHFLDINLEEKIDLDARWVAETKRLAGEINASWLCGDAGRWHYAQRERGHGVLLPPILCRESAIETAESIALREKAQELRRLAPEPAAALHEGRPTKRDRRDIDRARDWGSRWSASVDD